MNEKQILESTISEYEALLRSLELKGDDEPNVDRLIKRLTRSHDWTVQGAEEIVRLANMYGAFMLRNALALAIVLKKEDGDLQY